MLKLLLLSLCVGASLSVKGHSPVRGSSTNTRHHTPLGTQRHRRSDDLGSLDAVVSRLSQEVQDLTAKLQAAENTQNQKVQELTVRLQTAENRLANQGSTFIRWGRSSCPNGSQLLYTGFAGGSDFRDPGSGNTLLCLSPDPVFDNSALPPAYGRLTGAQYYISGRLNTDALCAVCHTSLSSTLMVPGTNRCPASTVLQYSGYLSAAQATYEASTDFVCLDSQPEEDPGSSSDERPSAFLEHVVSGCAGSLACPPYQDSKVVTCAVCSM